MGLVKLTAKMSIASSEAPKPGEGPAYRKIGAGDPPTTSKFGADIDNIYSMFARAADKFGSNNCFGRRTADGFEWMTYAEAHEQMKEVAAGVATLDIPRGAGFGMYTVNCPEFQIVTIAMFALGYFCVPVYDTLGDNIVQFEVNHAELPIIFVDEKKLQSVGGVASACPTLKHVVQLSALNGASISGVSLTDLPSLRTAGKSGPLVRAHPRPLPARTARARAIEFNAHPYKTHLGALVRAPMPVVRRLHWCPLRVTRPPSSCTPRARPATPRAW